MSGSNKNVNSPQGVAADASTSGASQTGRTPGTRLLRDVEADENRILYDALYKSLDDADDQQADDELRQGDTVRGARDAKKEFLEAISKPMTAKAKDVGSLYQQLGDRRNARVLSRFVFTSVLMLTVPLLALMLGMKVIAPKLEMDDVLCGGFAAVGSTILIGSGYVIYALTEDPCASDAGDSVPKASNEKKKN